MQYAHREFPFSRSFADNLASDRKFREWVLRKTEFAEVAHTADLLTDEMLKQRTPGRDFWWNSYFHMQCECVGCKGGKETDVLAVFKSGIENRFALHVEVKRPGDKLTLSQALAYQARARCWVEKPPSTVLPHKAASTVLLFSESQREKFSEAASYFGTLISFEEMYENFPQADGNP